MKHVIGFLAVGLTLYIAAVFFVVGSPLDGADIQRYREASQLLAPVLIILSAGVVWQQLRLNFEVQSRTMFDALTQDIRAMEASIISWPDVYPYFYQSWSLEEASQIEQYRIVTIAMTRLDHIDGFLLRANTYKDAHARAEKGQDESIKSWIFDLFAMSPVMQEFLLEHKQWYSDELLAICMEVRDVLREV